MKTQPQPGLPAIIETPRLYLRPYMAGDGPLFYAAGQRNRTHLAVYEAQNSLNHLKDEIHAEQVVCEFGKKWAAREYFLMPIFVKGSHQWAGQVYIGPTHWDLPAFVLGYVGDVDHLGQGYISEAVNGVLNALFREVGAHRVTADCHEENIRSWKLLERCGFRREGHLRQNKKNPNGSFHGDYLYAILREEYLQNEQQEKKHGIVNPPTG